MIDDATAQLRRGVVEYCVLGLLVDAPRYGWELSSALTARGLIASIGTLYPLLSRLRDRGLISAFEKDSASGGPTRKYYRLTPEGADRLALFRAQWHPFVESVNDLLGKGTR